jgi:MFS family permease
MTPHHLDINIRDDQVILSIRACLRRPGFIHALVAFTVSGIVINTLSTFMDYLVRLNGVGREYTGIVGGSFQFCIMISSLIVGTLTDKTRAYYSVTVAMLVLGAFGLAECGVSLDSNRGSELRYALVIVAVLVGPLQPVSTELGVDVVYPLSENTVLVIQQLFSNLLSALFIPCFKAMKDIGIWSGDHEHPEYTFSFYLLIVLHATATVFFATFNGRYLRYEHELEKRAIEERRVEAKAEAELRAAFVRGEAYSDGLPETQSLMQHPFV